MGQSLSPATDRQLIPLEAKRADGQLAWLVGVWHELTLLSSGAGHRDLTLDTPPEPVATDLAREGWPGCPGSPRRRGSEANASPPTRANVGKRVTSASDETIACVIIERALRVAST